jgi:hypothetical protein
MFADAAKVICTSALSMSARRPAKDATAWTRSNLVSGQKVLDALKQAAERAKNGNERVGSGTLMSTLPFPQRYSSINLRLIWSRTDYAATLTTI